MKGRMATVCLMAGILLFGGTYMRRAEQEQALYVMAQKEVYPVVVIDAGHGGMDPRQG